MSLTDPYLQLAERHGHYCPMSTLGLRIGQEAVRLLSGFGDKSWQLCYLARTCAVDGIQFSFEQSDLKFDLQIEQQGQHLLHCRAPDGKELSLALSEEALRLAADYRQRDADGQQQLLARLRDVAADILIETRTLD